MDAAALDMVMGEAERREVSRFVKFVAPPQTRQSIAENPDVLNDVEIIIGGWGMPILDRNLLSHAPRLKAIFYAAGAIGSWVTQAVWDRNILVTTAIEANAVPVAEYTLANILFSLKFGWSLSRETHRKRIFPPRDNAPGNYGSRVGIISLGTIGRKVVELLKPFDLKIALYDPFVTAAEAKKLGVELWSLEAVFATCDVVSLHTPLLPETVGMITGVHFNSMKHGATFINTARGEIVREREMIEVLSRRSDLQAVLDVTIQEPPPADSPLYTLPNIVLTPHIAGSVGKECRRMGGYMIEEIKRYVAGEKLKWQVSAEAAEHSTHRPVLAVKVNKPSVRPVVAALQPK